MTELSDGVHLALVLLHIFGAIIFLGNLIVSAIWMANAKRTRSADVLYFAARTVMRADLFLTLPGILLVLITGIFATLRWGGFGHVPWAELGLALFMLAGILWGAVLLRLQKQMIAIAREAVELKIGLSERFFQVYRKWMMWGGIVTLLPLAVLYLMVFKPQLWG